MTDNTIFHVPDMTCGHCEKTVRGALEEVLPGVSVAVDLGAQKVSVAGDAATAENAIRDAGYNPVKVAA